MSPTVSIITPCYNASGYLDRAIRSVLAQTLNDWELIIADDASTDDSVSRIQDWARKDRRIRLRRLDTNAGPSAARNAAIEIAEGAWIAVLDADDSFHPNRLEKLTAIARTSGADLVFDNLTLFDDHDQMETGTALPRSGAPAPIGLETLIVSEGPATQFKLGFLKPLIRKTFLDAHQLRYTARFRFAEDFDLYARALLEGARAILTPEPLYVYTTQVGKRSGRKSPGTRTVFDPGIRIDMANALIQDYGTRVSPDQRQLLDQLREWQILYNDIVTMSKCRRAWNIPGFLGIALRNPSAFTRYVATSRATSLIKRHFGHAPQAE